MSARGDHPRAQQTPLVLDKIIDRPRRAVRSHPRVVEAADLAKYAGDCVRFAPSRPELLNAVEALEEVRRLLLGGAA